MSQRKSILSEDVTSSPRRSTRNSRSMFDSPMPSTSKLKAGTKTKTQEDAVPVPVRRSQRFPSAEPNMEHRSPEAVIPRRRVTRSMSKSPTSLGKLPSTPKRVSLRKSSVNERAQPDTKVASLEIIKEREDEINNIDKTNNNTEASQPKTNGIDKITNKTTSKLDSSDLTLRLSLEDIPNEICTENNMQTAATDDIKQVIEKTEIDNDLSDKKSRSDSTSDKVDEETIEVDKTISDSIIENAAEKTSLLDKLNKSGVDSVDEDDNEKQIDSDKQEELAVEVVDSSDDDVADTTNDKSTSNISVVATDKTKELSIITSNESDSNILLVDSPTSIHSGDQTSMNDKEEGHNLMVVNDDGESYSPINLTGNDSIASPIKSTKEVNIMSPSALTKKTGASPIIKVDAKKPTPKKNKLLFDKYGNASLPNEKSPKKSKYEGLDSDESSSFSEEEEAVQFLDDEAMEVSGEDSPDPDSNDIIDLGESIGSTNSEIDSDESYEKDSFLTGDEDEGELLSSDDEVEKAIKNEPKKLRRIQTIESSEEEIDKLSLKPFGGKSPSIDSSNQISSIESDEEAHTIHNKVLSELIEEGQLPDKLDEVEKLDCIKKICRKVQEEDLQEPNPISSSRPEEVLCITDDLDEAEIMNEFVDVTNEEVKAQTPLKIKGTPAKVASPKNTATPDRAGAKTPKEKGKSAPGTPQSTKKSKNTPNLDKSVLQTPQSTKKSKTAGTPVSLKKSVLESPQISSANKSRNPGTPVSLEKSVLESPRSSGAKKSKSPSTPRLEMSIQESPQSSSAKKSKSPSTPCVEKSIQESPQSSTQNNVEEKSALELSQNSSPPTSPPKSVLGTPQGSSKKKQNPGTPSFEKSVMGTPQSAAKKSKNPGTPNLEKSVLGTPQSAANKSKNPGTPMSLEKSMLGSPQSTNKSKTPGTPTSLEKSVLGTPQGSSTKKSKNSVTPQGSSAKKSKNSDTPCLEESVLGTPQGSSTKKSKNSVTPTSLEKSVLGTPQGSSTKKSKDTPNAGTPKSLKNPGTPEIPKGQNIHFTGNTKDSYVSSPEKSEESAPNPPSAKKLNLSVTKSPKVNKQNKSVENGYNFDDFYKNTSDITEENVERITPSKSSSVLNASGTFDITENNIISPKAPKARLSRENLQEKLLTPKSVKKASNLVERSPNWTPEKTTNKKSPSPKHKQTLSNKRKSETDSELEKSTESMNMKPRGSETETAEEGSPERKPIKKNKRVSKDFAQIVLTHKIVEASASDSVVYQSDSEKQAKTNKRRNRKRKIKTSASDDIQNTNSDESPAKKRKNNKAGKSASDNEITTQESNSDKSGTRKRRNRKPKTFASDTNTNITVGELDSDKSGPKKRRNRRKRKTTTSLSDVDQVSDSKKRRNRRQKVISGVTESSEAEQKSHSDASDSKASRKRPGRRARKQKNKSTAQTDSHTSDFEPLTKRIAKLDKVVTRKTANSSNDSITQKYYELGGDFTVESGVSKKPFKKVSVGHPKPKRSLIKPSTSGMTGSEFKINEIDVAKQLKKSFKSKKQKVSMQKTTNMEVLQEFFNGPNVTKVLASDMVKSKYRKRNW